ncbi:hypothetical protein [Haloarcula marismortui]|uniref:Uncharacterized protein n=1 Tax=Haloarcula marismortui ATCC 33799 TaxID=662475 RepID=M0JMB7_9EURY|nr:hypothetical protein [Haloarcula californiae]EMA09483.1 hypothetical protein C435_21984 [Haloarcula californiae ATCC 33799]
MTKYSTSDDSTDFDNDDSGEVTLNDANTARAGYQSEAQIAKRKYELDTPETNENPEVKELETPTAPMGAHLDNQDELLTAVQGDEDQPVETADEAVGMEGNNNQQFKVDRDVRYSSPERADRGEYDTKSDEEVAENMGLDDLPVADQSDKEPAPEPVDRRRKETQAMYEERIAREVDDARRASEARAIAEPTDAPVEQAGEPSLDELPVENAKYATGWFDANTENDAEGGMSPTRQRAAATRHGAAAVADRALADFEERAKWAAGLAVDESWSPVERIGEEIQALGEYVQRVAKMGAISERRALHLLCRERLQTGSAQEAALNAVKNAPEYFKTAPRAIDNIEDWRKNVTVQGEVVRLFDPMNASEHQVALIDDVKTGKQFRFLIHENTRTCRNWTEWAGDIVTDLREGDVVRIIDAKPHDDYGAKGASKKVHACQWTYIQRLEQGGGAYVSRHSPRSRVIEASEFDGDVEAEGPAQKPPKAYNLNESTLDQRRASKPNGASQDTDYERRATADPTLVEWKFRQSSVPEKHAHRYQTEAGTPLKEACDFDGDSRGAYAPVKKSASESLGHEGEEVDCPVGDCEYEGSVASVRSHMGGMASAGDMAHAHSELSLTAEETEVATIDCPVDGCDFGGMALKLQAHMVLNATDEDHAEADISDATH